MDAWNQCLRRIQHLGYNKGYLWGKDRWLKKLGYMAKDWNQFGYQLRGTPPKTKKTVIGHLTMEERLKACVKKWRDGRKIPGWLQTLENRSSNWRDRGKYLRGRKAFYV